MCGPCFLGTVSALKFAYSLCFSVDEAIDALSQTVADSLGGRTDEVNRKVKHVVIAACLDNSHIVAVFCASMPLIH